MSNTIYASFLHPKDGKKAAGALLDHGVLKADLSLIVSESYLQNDPTFWDTNTDIGVPKTGVTTTTAADAESGAATGAATMVS